MTLGIFIAPTFEGLRVPPPPAARVTSFGQHADSRIAQDSVEPQGRPKLLVIHVRKIISAVHVPCPAEEEFVKGFHSSGTQRISDTTQGNLRKKRLRSRNGNKLELVGEYPRPVRNEMIPGEGYVRITACDHLRKIAMHDAKATRKAWYLRSE